MPLGLLQHGQLLNWRRALCCMPVQLSHRRGRLFYASLKCCGLASVRALGQSVLAACSRPPMRACRHGMPADTDAVADGMLRRPSVSKCSCVRSSCLQGRQVHMTADTDAVENVTFIYCPPERQVRVEVPLKVRQLAVLIWPSRSALAWCLGDCAASDLAAAGTGGGVAWALSVDACTA